MNEFATYTRPAFLGDHPPVLADMVLEGSGTEKTVPAGSVLGRDKNGKLAPWSNGFSDACGVLADDVVIPETGNVIVSVYIHASVVARELVFDASVSEEEKMKAIASLRCKGIYSDVTWALNTEDFSSDTENSGAGKDGGDE